MNHIGRTLMLPPTMQNEFSTSKEEECMTKMPEISSIPRYETLRHREARTDRYQQTTERKVSNGFQGLKAATSTLPEVLNKKKDLCRKDLVRRSLP